MPVVKLYLFGNLDICYEGHPLDKPPTLKSQSLFAYLIYHRDQPQPRERLAGLFWGDRTTRKARSSLSTSLWHIRRCLPDEDILLADPHRVQFDPQADLWLDTRVFESQALCEDAASLQKAVALYRGDFLDGFYDDWIVDERYRLEALFTETLARLMVVQDARGEHGAALTTALRLLSHNPLREDAHQSAMRAYCQLGQRASALKQYQRCQQILQRELGVEPLIETTELYQAILDGQIKVGPVLAPLPAQPQALIAGHSPLDVTATSPVIGRDEEMLFLQQLWQEVDAEEGRFVLVNGDAGVGKTRLVEAFADQVRWNGGRVLWGRCYEFERALPYQPISEAVRTTLSTLPVGKLTNLPPWSIAEVARLVPEIAEYFPGLTNPVQIQSEQEQARLFHGVSRYLMELSAQGALLLVLEDLHWASESTLQLLHYLARHLKDQSVLIIGTLRPDGLVPGHLLGALQQQLEHDGRCWPLHLNSLSRDSVTALIQEISGAGETVLPLANRLYLETEGNPFFLMEIVKALFESGVLRLDGNSWQGDFSQISSQGLPLPNSVSAAVQARVRCLEDETQEALRLVAVLGQAFDFDALKMIWERDDEGTLDAIDSLLRHRLIDEQTGAQDRDYVFSHHKIQEVVYAAIPDRRRQYLHALAGMVMEQIYEPHSVFSELAFHFEQAQRIDNTLTEKAVAYLREAGRQAASQYANAEAASYLSRALKLLPEDTSVERFDLLLLREKINGLRGERAAQEKDLAAMEALAKKLGNEQSALAILRQGRYHLSIGDYPLAQHYLGGALDRARAAGDRHREAAALNLLGAIHVSSGDSSAAQKHLKQAMAIYQSIGDCMGEAQNLSSLGSAYLMTGDCRVAESCYQQALALSRMMDDIQMEGQNLSLLGRLSRQLGELEAAKKYNLRALAIMRDIGHRDAEACCLHELGNLYSDLGDDLQALEVLEQAVAIFASLKNPRGESYAHVDLGLVCHGLGDREKALAHCQQGRDGLHAIGDRWGEAGSLNYIGQAQEGLNDWDAAFDAYSQGLAIKREIGQRAWAVEDLAGLARVAFAQDKLAEALNHVDESLAWIAKNGIAGLELPLLVYLTAYQVLDAAGCVKRAGEVLVEAYGLLMTRAENIKDEKLHCSFLENVAVNREIMAAYDNFNSKV